MIKIRRALKSNAILKALTGLKIKQFKMLAVHFEMNLTASFKEDRSVRLELGRGFVLRSAEEKLFFTLFYLKCYPIFDVAAWICYDLTLNGYSDWFLPSSDELTFMHENLHQDGFGGFADSHYWSSTEYSIYMAYYQFFSGNPGTTNKSTEKLVRAVRAF